VTLDNVDFFLPPTTDIKTDHLKLKDQVEVEIGFDVVYGRMQLVLQSINKVSAYLNDRRSAHAAY
jgi:hypothetical protein